MSGRTFPEALAETLALIPEHITDPAYLVSLFTDGHAADIERAYRAGRADEAADMAAVWRSMAEAVVYPERGAERRVRAAEAGCRRDAAAHERAFVARAHPTQDRDRTDAQRAAVHVYPRKAGGA
jgi:hypothetical protein